MKAMRERRRRQGLRELRIVMPDPRSKEVKIRLALQAARLSPSSETDALRWIEAVSEFDGYETR
ncbi:MAG: DUF3018 family protein [Rhodospirillales bacterium]|nr:MAG: DUF3018 family protein [Rhodospirillales bacterium]